MQLEQQESFEIKGPQLEIFGETETKLPAPAKKRPTAIAVLVVLAALSVFGIGGAKLKGRYDRVQAAYVQMDEHDHGVQTELAAQADSAASFLRVAQGMLGEEDASCQALAAALETWNGAAATPAAQSSASTGLYTALNTVYSAALDKSTKGEEQRNRLDDLYNEFTSNHLQVGIYAADYTKTAQDYNKTTAGFPANVIGALWGTAAAEEYIGQ